MVVRKRLKIVGPSLAFITTTVTDWTQVFNIKAAALETLRQLERTLTQHHASIAGYVLMPSHIHMLIGLPEISHLSKFVQTFKSMSSRRLKEMDMGIYKDYLYKRGRFRLWKPRFDDVIITSEKQFHIKLDYIHNNPIKAGLVSRSSDWLFSSAADWILDNRGILQIDKSFKWTTAT